MSAHDVEIHPSSSIPFSFSSTSFIGDESMDLNSDNSDISVALDSTYPDQLRNQSRLELLPMTRYLFALALRLRYKLRPEHPL